MVIDETERTDLVIAERWDVMASLIGGPPSTRGVFPRCGVRFPVRRMATRIDGLVLEEITVHACITKALAASAPAAAQSTGASRA
jgi:hypothetical protein